MKDMRMLTTLSMLLAVSIVLNIVEMQIPNPLILAPGAKIGLANIITIIILYIYGFKYAFIMNISRVLIVALLSPKGFDYTFYMALSGAISSVVVMGIFYRFFKLHVVTISVIGAVMHTIGQVVVLMFSLETMGLIYYLPIMLTISIPSGILIGMIAKKFFTIFESRPRPQRMGD